MEHPGQFWIGTYPFRWSVFGWRQHESVQEEVIDAVAVAKKEINELIKRLGKAGRTGTEELRELKQYSAVLDKFHYAGSKSLKRTDDRKDSGFYVGAMTFSPVHSLPSISVMPHNPGQIMSKLWSTQEDDLNGLVASPLSSVLLTSATLGVPGNYSDPSERFKSIAFEMGIYTSSAKLPTGEDKPKRIKTQRAELDLWACFEPEKFGAVKFILADPSLDSPVAGIDEHFGAKVDDVWLDYATKMIQKAHAAGGRSLVLCNSYADVERFTAKLGSLGGDLVAQRRGQSSNECIPEFLAKPSTVWLSPSVWEGLNLPGCIANLVIPRIPFSGQDETEKAMLVSRGKHDNETIDKILRGRMMGATQRKMRQGIGRPIRTVKDKARIWIADPRFPLHSLSQVGLHHPKSIRYSSARRFSILHSVVPKRFTKALVNAEVMLKNGTLVR